MNAEMCREGGGEVGMNLKYVQKKFGWVLISGLGIFGRRMEMDIYLCAFF